MKVAIIGAGIAGNTLVWQLMHQHEVTVYEAGTYIGGHTHTRTLELEGKVLNVDSGFIVFNQNTYPNFINMLIELGVAKQPTEMSFSVHCEKTGFEYAGSSLNSLFAQRSNMISPRFYGLIRDILKFNKRAPQLLCDADQSVTLGEYLRDEDYGDFFCRYYILPMGAAIWSQSMAAMLDFPAQFFVRFFVNHGLLNIADRPQWYVVEGGSRSYVEAIYREFPGKMYLETPVTRVQRFEDCVEVTSNRGIDRYDAVFFACHSDQALAILEDASSDETAVLSAFPYQQNTAILHLGDDLLPKRKLAGSSWNYRLSGVGEMGATVTYDMKKLQSLPLSGDLCVTLNGGENLDAAKIIDTTTYHHPVFTRQGVQAQEKMHLISGTKRTFYCGAYWRYGFHEDGVVSALAALKHFNNWAERHENLSLHRAR